MNQRPPPPVTEPPEPRRLRRRPTLTAHTRPSHPPPLPAPATHARTPRRRPRVLSHRVQLVLHAVTPTQSWYLRWVSLGSTATAASEHWSSRSSVASVYRWVGGLWARSTSRAVCRCCARSRRSSCADPAWCRAASGRTGTSGSCAGDGEGISGSSCDHEASA